MPKYAPSGRRERHFFATKTDAESFARAERLRADREGHTIKSSLTPVQRETAAAAFKLIGEGERPSKLLEIVEEWEARRRQANASVKLEEAFKAYTARGKKTRSRGGMTTHVPFSTKHARGIKYAEKALEAHKDTKVADLTKETITEALAPCSASYFNAHLRIIRAVFAYAVERGWATINEADKVEMRSKPRAKAKRGEDEARGEAEILTVAQTRDLLLAADEAAPQYLPYLALALFAGIRPDLEDGELVKMTWEMIHLEDKRIIIPADVSKTRQRRVIEMEDNLVAWLEHSAKPEERKGPIMDATNAITRMRVLRGAAGIAWKQDIMRHSFASYHLSHFENLVRCVTSMGHRDSTMLWQHYHASVPKAEAAKYWEITPEALGLR